MHNIVERGSLMSTCHNDNPDHNTCHLARTTAQTTTMAIHYMYINHFTVRFDHYSTGELVTFKIRQSESPAIKIVQCQTSAQIVLSG